MKTPFLIARRSFSFETWPLWAKMGAIAAGVPLSLMTVKSVATVLLQDRLIYASYLPLGSRRHLRSPSYYGLEFKDIALRSLDQTRLHAWELKAPNADIRNGVMLYFQGNAGNLGHRLHHLQLLSDNLAIPILALHYRGYGPSRGRPSQRGIQRDADALLHYAKETYPNAPKYLFGQSIGGAVALDLAARRSGIDAVLVENTFTTMQQLVQSIYPKWTLVHHLTPLLWNPWNSLKCAESLQCPLLVVSGAEDEVVPPVMSDALFDGSKRSKYKMRLALPGGMHDDTWRQPGYWDGVCRFMEGVKKLEESHHQQD